MRSVFREYIRKLGVLLKSLFVWFKSILSEQDGLGSASRITAFLTTIFVLGWVTFVVIHTGTLPDLTSASLFLAAGTGGYAANKLSSLLKGD